MDRIAVHIFSTRYEEADCGDLARNLSGEELARAARFRFAADRVRAVVCRARLRSLAAALAGTTPERIEFSYVRNGKPVITAPADAAKIHVNVSHSGDLGAVALSRVCPVGVDLEYMRGGIEIAQVANYYFREEERGWLLSLPESDQQRGFHRLWVLKEAILKASGDGLSLPLDSIPVRIEATRVQTGPWPAIELEVPGPYCAAVCASATEMPPVDLSLWPDTCSSQAGGSSRLRT